VVILLFIAVFNDTTNAMSKAKFVKVVGGYVGRVVTAGFS